MNKEELKKDWLANNALLAFVGALLMGTVWQASEGTGKILFVCTVPDYSEWVVLAVIVVLFCLSIFLALAAWSEWVRRYAVRWWTYYSQPLGVLVWIIFMLSWLPLIPKLPEQWWSIPLVLAGLFFTLVFIPLRAIQSKSRREKTGLETGSEASHANDD